MELTTFGAIMSFALELEKQSLDFYEQNAHGNLKELFNKLAGSTRKRLKRLERTRREGVTEMILEPIRGLNGEDYSVELSDDGEETKVLMQVIALEENTRRFYVDAAEKMPVKDVVQVITRLAHENKERLSELNTRLATGG